MGLISNLLRALAGAGKTATVASAPAPRSVVRSKRVDISVRDRFLSINGFEFYGTAHRSANQQWVVGLRDSDGISRGGARDKGNGLVVLVNLPQSQWVHTLRTIERPMDAAVADDGSYVVADSGFVSALECNLLAIDPSGEETFRLKYLALIYNLGLSDCGRYAVVQTCNSPGSDDSSVLEVIDLTEKLSVFKRAPATGWADSYGFDVQNGELKTLWVEHKDLGRFPYSAAGDFHEDSAYQDARLTRGDYATKAMAAQQLLKTDSSVEAAKRALVAADASISSGGAEDRSWGAIAYRAKGEALEVLNDLRGALAAYEEALARNPKIGVRNRLASLKKALKS